MFFLFFFVFDKITNMLPNDKAELVSTVFSTGKILTFVSTPLFIIVSLYKSRTPYTLGRYKAVWYYWWAKKMSISHNAAAARMVANELLFSSTVPAKYECYQSGTAV